MSVLGRYTKSIDGTIPVSALLYDDERLLASQDGVGLYDGPNKSPLHQSGSLHVTNHRLFFIANASSSSPLIAPTASQERGASLALDLSCITHTESYAGFLRSSAKITIHLASPEIKTTPGDTTPRSKANFSTPVNPNGTEDAKELFTSVPMSVSSSTLKVSDNNFEIWECEICGHRNPPGLSPAARLICSLCGMPRSTTVSSSTAPSLIAPNFKERSNLSAPVPIAISRSSAASGSMSLGDLHSRSLPSSTSASPAPPFPSTNTPLSTERVLKRRPSAISCPACTFLNHPSLYDCEICGTPLRSGSGTPSVAVGSSRTVPSSTELLHPSRLTSKSAPTSRPTSPDGNGSEDNLLLDVEASERDRFIRLSFRKGGDKVFYAALKTSLQTKEWQTKTSRVWNKGKSQEEGVSAFRGLHGILDSLDKTSESTENALSTSFADLDALMHSAQRMVKLAKDLNEQLTAANARAASDGATSANLEPEEASFIRSSLVQLGLSLDNVPITSDMSNNEKKYIEQLAGELGRIILGSQGGGQKNRPGLMRERGIVGLDEVWGGWNRARGVALVSPEMTLKVLPYLPKYTNPQIHSRVLVSGLRVLHTPEYTPSAFSARLVNYIFDHGPCSSTDFSTVEKLNVGLVDELIRETESRGNIVRDDLACAIDGAGAGASAGAIGVEVKWWTNVFSQYIWDGQE